MRYFVVVRRLSAGSISLYFPCEVSSASRAFLLDCSRPFSEGQPSGCAAAPTRRTLAMSFRRDFITKPIFALARTALPPLSDTEREALEAGDVWWDADLFTGNPDWSKLLSYAPATLTA